MHGCVTEPKDIVLTRTDYLRYSERRAALAGIVQALLITRHILFVGFSLTDDNFHRIVDEVRRAVGEHGAEAREHFGTALLLNDDPLLDELWANELRCVPVEVAAPPFGTAAAARRVEIFLDYLLAESTDITAHLLDHSYDAVLSDGEREVRRRLEELQLDLGEEARESEAWAAVERLLGRLGGGDRRRA